MLFQSRPGSEQGILAEGKGPNTVDLLIKIVFLLKIFYVLCMKLKLLGINHVLYLMIILPKTQTLQLLINIKTEIKYKGDRKFRAWVKSS